MAEIHFFDSVIYQGPNKSIAQNMLETVDEYFNLGNKYRVRIFDAENPEVYGMYDRRERHRSQLNVILKVASYATIVIPLIALLLKAVLRAYLGISSVRLDSFSRAGQSWIETRMPADLTKQCVSFLSYKDQGQFAQVALFCAEYVRGLQEQYIKWTAPFKGLIPELPLSSPNIEEYRHLILGLITSPAIGHPHYWNPLMDEVLKRFLPKESSGNTIGKLIQGHAQIACALAVSETPISSSQLYHFFKYLQSNQLFKFKAWVGYRVLEQYMITQGLDYTSAKRVLHEYLTCYAEIYIKAQSFSNDTLKYKRVEIDPRIWFGLTDSDQSLLRGKTEGEQPSIPEPLLEALWTRILSLRNGCLDMPFEVGMYGRVEAPLPRNFTLKLAQRITNAEIYLYSNNTVRKEELEKPEYAGGINRLTKEEEQALIGRYPKASVAHLS